MPQIRTRHDPVSGWSIVCRRFFMRLFGCHSDSTPVSFSPSAQILPISMCTVYVDNSDVFLYMTESSLNLM